MSLQQINFRKAPKFSAQQTVSSELRNKWMLREEALTDVAGQWSKEDELWRILMIDDEGNLSTIWYNDTTGQLLTQTPQVGVDFQDPEDCMNVLEFSAVIPAGQFKTLQDLLNDSDILDNPLDPTDDNTVFAIPVEVDHVEISVKSGLEGGVMDVQCGEMVYTVSGSNPAYDTVNNTDPLQPAVVAGNGTYTNYAAILQGRMDIDGFIGTTNVDTVVNIRMYNKALV